MSTDLSERVADDPRATDFRAEILYGFDTVLSIDGGEDLAALFGERRVVRLLIVIARVPLDMGPEFREQLVASMECDGGCKSCCDSVKAVQDWT